MAGICAIALAVTYPGGQAVTAAAAAATRQPQARAVTAAGHWAPVAAALTGAVAVAMACTPGRPRGAAPVLGAGGIPDHG